MSYADYVADRHLTDRMKGFMKIDKTCLIAAAEGIQYAWVDTCFIRNVAQKTMPYKSGGCCRRNRGLLKF